MSTETAADDVLPDDEVIATLSDYLDGVLPSDRKRDVEQKLQSDPVWKSTHDELRETRDQLSGLMKARAPEKFDQDVTETIHKRSAGRFFAKRTFGDRIPLGVLLIIGVIAIVIIGAILWSSSTGSLKRDKTAPSPQGSGALLPKP
jgi:anti-sigma factor RsiW